MQQAANWINYEERLNRVTAYIYAHLDDELDFLKLAEVAFLSPYHFHRIYRAARGETVATTVRRLRLHRAAGHLAQTTLPIAEISLKAGYKNIQSFTRTFNAIYGMPPARYRNHGSHTQYQSTNLERSLAMYNITLKTLPDLEVVSIKHSGSYLQISQEFGQLGSWLGARNLLDANTRMMGVYYDDPDTVAEKDLRSRACMTVSKPCVLEAPLERITIAGGEYAVLLHKGSYDGLAAAYQWFFGTWLLQSGRELRDAP
ncbi:MAG: AraC family transcriptional regulator, partial [Gallionella sp.]|nr:AraC family transcriptional regulator [Gallionella sp.]